MQSGRLRKSIGGFYYVETTDGIIECKARGKFRKQEISPAAGDWVEVEPIDAAHGVVVGICERKNYLVRPPIANLDALVFVVSVCAPSPSFSVLDRLIAIAEHKEIEPMLAVTKSDLQPDRTVAATYQACGFPTFDVSLGASEGLHALKSQLGGKTVAFIGNSGVGKTTLLNRIAPELFLETGEVSKKLGRGRHTTRQVELFKLQNGGYIADTPGFSTVDVMRYARIRKEALADCFREFAPYTADCRFSDCAHLQEDGCAVLQAVSDGKIPRSRHQSYLEMYRAASQLKDWERNT